MFACENLFNDARIRALNFSTCQFVAGLKSPNRMMQVTERVDASRIQYQSMIKLESKERKNTLYSVKYFV